MAQRISSRTWIAWVAGPIIALIAALGWIGFGMDLYTAKVSKPIELYYGSDARAMLQSVGPTHAALIEVYSGSICVSQAPSRSDLACAPFYYPRDDSKLSIIVEDRRTR